MSAHVWVNWHTGEMQPNPLTSHRPHFLTVLISYISVFKIIQFHYFFININPQHRLKEILFWDIMTKNVWKALRTKYCMPRLGTLELLSWIVGKELFSMKAAIGMFIRSVSCMKTVLGVPLSKCIFLIS